jgi:hypothetical protein
MKYRPNSLLEVEVGGIYKVGDAKTFMNSEDESIV